MDDNENHLIDMLPRRERTRLLAQCQQVPLLLSDVLCDIGEATRHAWFPISGFISMVTQVDNHPGVEVGMVGREGMFGAPLGVGMVPSPWRALVQGPGAAWRISATALRQQMADTPVLQQLLHRYLYVLTAQLSTSAACLRFHLIEPRLARWLLLSQDRAHADNFHVTHEFLAYMLGVRRVGVTAAAGALQRAGLIHYHRGELEVLDRPGLEAASCSCYAANRTVYNEHMS